MGYYNNNRRSNNRPRYSRGGNAGSRGRNKSFDPRTIINKSLESEEVNVAEMPYDIRHQFVDFGLSENMIKNVLDHGYETPTPIQDQAIPEIMKGNDVVGVANTGTGKTAAFLIPLINKVHNNKNSRVLIIAPTRELAVQINDELEVFSKNLSIYSAICIGGVSLRGQVIRLQRRPQFVIGTPGRLLDLANQRVLDFNSFDTIVLDEVDRMLDMGFISSIDDIISQLPRERQSLFFSATLDASVHQVMSRFIHNPVMISVKTTDSRKNIEQDIIELRGRNKADLLCQILDEAEVIKTLIFMRTKRSADMLQRNLSGIGFNSAVMHGNKTQNQRQRSLDLFRSNKVNILIATDVAARGIDVEDITHVINFDLPESYDAYIHRIGRTGRADKKGIAITFV